MPATTVYDVLVIGSGPAGERAAATAGFLGKRAALIERDVYLGGASANTGTLPSKTLRETALALSGFRARELYGVDLSLRREADVRDFLYHENHVREAERLRVGEFLHKRNVDVIHGEARFLSAREIAVREPSGDERVLAAEFIVIATGSSPVQPAGFDFPDARIWDSDEILSIEKLPRTLAVVGAGVIGSEYACTFAALGVEVHVIDGRDVLMPFLDREIAVHLEQGMRNLGIRFHWKEQVTTCDTTRAIGPVELTTSSASKYQVDAVLVAAGRKSNTEALNLAAAGVATGQRGLIPVNERYQTSAPNIYAVGDVIGFPALAATSAEQGRVAVAHAFGVSYKRTTANLLPVGIYTIPEVSALGPTEEQLRADGVDYIAARAPYASTVRGQIVGDKTGLMKLMFARSDFKLLAVHIVGEHATEIIHTGEIAMLTGETGQIFLDACFNHPTLGELYKFATIDALSQVPEWLRRG